MHPDDMTRAEVEKAIASLIVEIEEAQKSTDPKVRHNPDHMRRTLELIDLSERFR